MRESPSPTPRTGCPGSSERRHLPSPVVPPAPDTTLLHIPPTFLPSHDEAAVLSIVAVRANAAWELAVGSLLSVPLSVARMSWGRWNELQPPTRRPAYDGGGFDFGPIFSVDPFPGVRVVRTIVAREDWLGVAEDLEGGRVRLPNVECEARVEDWTPIVLLTQGDLEAAHRVVAGIKRPVSAVVGSLPAIDIPKTDAAWRLESPPHLPRGLELGSLFKHRYLLHWPRSLLAIDWLGDSEHGPPPRLVVGRPQCDAWIADVTRGSESSELAIALAWDERRIDPLGCSVLLRLEKDGLLLTSRQVRLSDLPGRTVTPEPRKTRWAERTLEIGLPRGPRLTDWGVSLFASDGRLLDERPLAPRYEQFSVEFRVVGDAGPASTVVGGDRRSLPTASESDDEVALAIRLDRDARRAAAARRLSTQGELESYLRWRLSCVEGELLLLDPHLLRGETGRRELAFLEGLDRPVRALTGGIARATTALLAARTSIAARVLPLGRRSLHDRVWIVGETGLLIGGSITTFLPDPGAVTRRATTATELPFGDVAAWRELFERWWAGHT